MLTPVVLPPGRAMLAASPLPIMSSAFNGKDFCQLYARARVMGSYPEIVAKPNICVTEMPSNAVAVLLDRRLRNECGDLAVLDAAETDALLEARIVARGRLRIGDVDHVVLVDGNVARPAELFPFGNKLAVQIHD
jgi:hypothetical protein